MSDSQVRVSPRGGRFWLYVVFWLSLINVPVVVAIGLGFALESVPNVLMGVGLGLLIAATWLVLDLRRSVTYPRVILFGPLAVGTILGAIVGPLWGNADLTDALRLLTGSHERVALEDVPDSTASVLEVVDGTARSELMGEYTERKQGSGQYRGMYWDTEFAVPIVASDGNASSTASVWLICDDDSLDLDSDLPPGEARPKCNALLSGPKRGFLVRPPSHPRAVVDAKTKHGMKVPKDVVVVEVKDSFEWWPVEIVVEALVFFGALSVIGVAGMFLLDWIRRNNEESETAPT